MTPDGFLALPASGKGSAVLVLHAWWGLNDTIKAFCKRLADSGFVVFAPDLYHGKIAKEISEAGELSSALDQNVDAARADVSAAVAYLKEKSGDSDVTVIGFSLGAFYAADLSTREADNVRKVVLFYGTGPGDYSKAKAAYLGHFAESDPYEPAEYAKGLEEGLKHVGRPVNFYTYPGTTHWFFEPDRVKEYNAAAAALAWDRTLAFLKG